MKWIKKGLIFKPGDIQSEFIKSHAQIPTVAVLGKKLRIYFATRPEKGLSMTTYMDVDINNPKHILYVHQKPILELGKDGMFDEHGIMPNFIYRENDRYYLHYVGWSRRESVPYSNWMGLAVSEDEGESFTKMFDGPFLDRTRDELYSSTGTWLVKVNDLYHMWYARGTSWRKIDGNYEHQYNIVAAVSNDGITWEHNNKEIFERKSELEASTRPTVIFRDNKWHMWFSYRSLKDFRTGPGGYRIGYAWSDDLYKWHRDDDKAGIESSETGWDSTMMAYPYVVETSHGVYMFYNGNGFGQAGYGYAVLDE